MRGFLQISNFQINIQCWVSLMRCSVSIGQYSPPRKSHVMTILSNPITMCVYSKSPFRRPGRFQEPYISLLHANHCVLTTLLYSTAKATIVFPTHLPFSKANNCFIHLILCLLQIFFTHNLFLIRHCANENSSTTI